MKLLFSHYYAKCLILFRIAENLSNSQTTSRSLHFTLYCFLLPILTLLQRIIYCAVNYSCEGHISVNNNHQHVKPLPSLTRKDRHDPSKVIRKRGHTLRDIALIRKDKFTIYFLSQCLPFAKMDRTEISRKTTNKRLLFCRTLAASKQTLTSLFNKLVSLCVFETHQKGTYGVNFYSVRHHHKEFSWEQRVQEVQTQKCTA